MLGYFLPLNLPKIQARVVLLEHRLLQEGILLLHVRLHLWPPLQQHRFGVVVVAIRALGRVFLASVGSRSAGMVSKTETKLEGNLVK